MLKKDKANVETSKSFVFGANPYPSSESIIDYLNKKVATLENKVEGLCSAEKSHKNSPYKKTQMLRRLREMPKSFSKPVYK